MKNMLFILILLSCTKSEVKPMDNFKLVFSNYQQKSGLQDPIVWVEYNNVPTEFTGSKTISWFNEDTEHYKISIVTTQCTVEVQLYVNDKLVGDTLVQTSKSFTK